MFKRENIRKNLLRVKQTVDQNLGRAEKSEVLSDDLQESEKKVDTAKHVYTTTCKKVSASLLSSGTSDLDKRIKKIPEHAVGYSMIESAGLLGNDTVMGQMFETCGKCQSELARKHLQYELDVEKDVVQPIQEILDVEIPQITKLKKALNKVTLDMDSAKSRWNTAVRQTQVPGVNMASASAKADVVKEELEEAQNRVDQARDALTTEIFHFMSKEAEHTQNLLSLLEAQAKYHRQALEEIEKVIPKMQETLHCNPAKPVYGISLEEHLRVTNRDIAQVLEACICYLLETGLDEEGLFRIAGMASKVKKLKASFDAGVDLDDDTGDLDQHTVAGALKQYLRELPEPLLTFKLYPDFIAAVQKQNDDDRLQALWCVVDRLPKPNYDNFRYLIKFLAKLVEKSEVNKMTPGNIAIVIGPNLIWPEGDAGQNMMNTGILSLIIESIVTHADWFFPGDIDFRATQRGMAPEHRMSDHSSAPARSPKVAIATKSQSTPSNQPTQPVNHLPLGRGKTPTGKACGAALGAIYYPISGQVSSAEVSSASSDNLSIDKMSIPYSKSYETADTLERVDNFPTMKGDKRLSCPAATTTNTPSQTHKVTRPITTFNPQDRERYRAALGPKPEVPPKHHLESQHPPPPNVHSDMYSTAFALQSLGDGTWPTYLNKVRSIWDNQFQHRSADNINEKNSMENRAVVSGGQPRTKRSMSTDVTFGCTTPIENSSPVLQKTDMTKHKSLERSASNQSGSSGGTPHYNPASKDSSPIAPPQTPPTVSRSPSVSPGTSSSNLTTGAPLAESEEPHPVAPQRRLTRKPAPPPPQEKPYNVAATASVKPGYTPAQLSQTWPRQAAPQLVTPQDNETVGNDSTEPDKDIPSERKPTIQEKPHPPDRVSSLPGHATRPTLPPPVVPTGHQRSASMGTPVTIPGGTLDSASKEKTNSADQGNIRSSSLTPEKDIMDISAAGNQLPSPDSSKLNTNSLNRQSIARPARPLPPPPPPPENTITEESYSTHL